jgi:regulator of protease activity HflC (stomatin/prohibitin superfamily)
MLGIEFKKAPPTVYVIHYQDGKTKQAGPGLSFWYFAPVSTIVDVPLASVDCPFVFREVTSDYQDVTLQGQLTYRVSDPQKLASLMDFTVNSRGEYVSADEPPDLLVGQRLINAAQAIAKGLVEHMTLKVVLASADALVPQMLTSLRLSETVKMLGVEILDLSILAIKPTPEMSRALEAEAREVIQQRADQAIYARRNAAVEEERRIKESELNTEIAVETKKRQIRETKMAADIAVEEQRTMLIDKQVENDRKEADSKSYALEATLKPIQDVDWRTLMAISARGGDPRFAISMAFQQLAENANKIGQLNLTPDLLQSLIGNGDIGNVRKDNRGHS